MTMGFKDSRTSSEALCPINAEIKYLTVTLMQTPCKYLMLNPCPSLETSLNASSSDTTK